MAHERRQYILRLLEQRGRIRSAAIARELEVTDETIRTDLVALQQKGLLKRVHGGAEYIVPSPASADAAMRADVAMARLVAESIPTGARIYADACRFTRVFATTTTDKSYTFITPSPQLVLQLAPAALSHRIICTGGILDKETRLFCGDAAQEALRRLAPQFALLQPAAISPTTAAYHHALQARWAQLAADSAPQCIVATPASAFSALAPHAFRLPRFSLVTENHLPAGFEHIPTRTIPYISASMLRPADEF